jgi:hypothetical protein
LAPTQISLALAEIGTGLANVDRLRIVQGASTTTHARPETASSAARRRHGPGARHAIAIPSSATRPRPSPRVSAASPPSTPSATARPTVGRRIIATAASSVPVTNTPYVVSAISAPSGSHSIGYSAASTPAIRPTRSDRVTARASSAIRTTVTVPTHAKNSFWPCVPCRPIRFVNAMTTVCSGGYSAVGTSSKARRNPSPSAR